MAAVALFMVGRLAKFNDIFTSTVPTINNFSNHALRINCLTLFVQLKIQNNILFLYTTIVSNDDSILTAKVIDLYIEDHGVAAEDQVGIHFNDYDGAFAGSADSAHLDVVFDRYVYRNPSGGLGTFQDQPFQVALDAKAVGASIRFEAKNCDFKDASGPNFLLSSYYSSVV